MMNNAEKPQLTIPRVSCSYFYDNRHLHRFFKMRAAPLLMSENIFPNIKEITESMGAFVAIHEHLIKNGIDRNSDKVDVYAIGDGHSPRTAALIACLTKWNCISIDPEMRPKTWNFKRLTTFRNKIEDVSFDGKNDRIAIIVCVHSHAKLTDCLKSINNYKERHLINIPCCVKADLEFEPNFTFCDVGIQSEKQNVSVYLNCH